MFGYISYLSKTKNKINREDRGEDEESHLIACHVDIFTIDYFALPFYFNNNK